MQQPEPSTFFNQEHAAQYDQRFARLAPLREALHMLAGAVLAGLPEQARILCVGAGTGAELIYFAQRFPGWQFTAVDPSGPMLEVCRRRAQELGFASRCVFHEGYLDSLPASEAFDAATSFLVSQFILDPERRADFFRGIGARLVSNGWLVTADLSDDVSSPEYQSLLGVWMRLMQDAGIPAEKVENLRVAYGRDVALLPLDRVSALIAAGGFEAPIRFLQTGLIHAWYARKALAGSAVKGSLTGGAS